MTRASRWNLRVLQKRRSEWYLTVQSFYSATDPSRKLPSLSSKLVVTTPADNPALHQGRVRSSPHVDGRWACHLYVPVVLETGEQLGEVLSSAFRSAKTRVPTLHSIGLDNGRWELHVSLSRPTFLWTHQREEFKNAVGRVAASCKGWVLSLTEFITLENEDRSRVFLAVQVGAGHEQVDLSLSLVPVCVLNICLQLGALTDALAPALRAIKQSEFYPEPKFHVSIGWALLEGSGIETPNIAGEDEVGKLTGNFPTIAELPQDMIEELNRDFGSRLRRPSAHVEAEEVCAKIGKDAFRWGLGPGR